MKSPLQFLLVIIAGAAILAGITGGCGSQPVAPAAATLTEKPAVATVVARETSAPPATSEKPALTTTPTRGGLVIFDWSGYELPQYWASFAEEYPAVNVDYSFFADDTEAFAKAQSGFKFDLLHPCSEYWNLYVDNGLVLPIDVKRLKHWPELFPKLAGQGDIGGKQYFIPWEWGYDSILVRKDLVKEMPDEWADLWDAQYAGHVSVFDGGESNHVVAALVLGFDPWKTTEAENTLVKQKLIELKPNLLNYWSDYTQINQLVASGDVWLAANTWNDAYLTLSRDGVPVEYIKPKEGRLGWVCGYGISSKTQNLDLAYAFLDALIDPQSMAAMANDYGNGAANAQSLPLIDPEIVRMMELEKPEILDTTIFYHSITDAQRQYYTDMWSEVKAAP